MSDLLWLTDAQMARMVGFFPRSNGKPRVDDRLVLSGIIFTIRNGLRWRDAPTAYGPRKTLHGRGRRWSEKGVRAGDDGRPRSQALKNVGGLLGDRGLDAEWSRGASQDKGIRACLPGRKQRKTPIAYDKRRSRIEIMVGKLKDWRRVAVRQNRCPKIFLSAIALPETVIRRL